MMRPADGSHGAGPRQALRRVRYGHVTVHAGETLLDGGAAFPHELVPFLRELFAHGQVRLGAQQGGDPQVVMTTAGEELLADLETRLDDRPIRGEHHRRAGQGWPTDGLAPPPPSRSGRLSALTEAEVVARWPFLAPIVVLPGPSWRFWWMAPDSLACQRIHDAYAESLWIIDENNVGLNRSPIRGGSARVVSPSDFAGTVNEVLAVLQQPVRWEDEQ
ncbi:MAG: hypothetical protein WBA97_06850 [Actinophytocola sp.]